MMFASQMALTIFLPAVVNMAEDLGTSLTRVQLIIPAYLGAFAIMQLVAGPLSDTFGRRPVILCGLALFTIASTACGLATSVEQLLVGRFFQAMGACTTIVVGRAIVRDGSDGKTAARTLSYLAMSLAVGPAVAPFFGGFLVSWFDWRATFFSTALLGLLALIAAIPRFVETLPPEARRAPNLAGMFRNYGELVRNRLFLGYSLTIAFMAGTFQTFIVAAPIVMINQMGVSPKLFGFYVMTVPASFMAGSFISARLSGRVPMDWMIAAGCTAAISGGLVQFIFAATGNSSPISILVAVLISNLGTGPGVRQLLRPGAQHGTPLYRRRRLGVDRFHPYGVGISGIACAREYRQYRRDRLGHLANGNGTCRDDGVPASRLDRADAAASSLSSVVISCQRDAVWNDRLIGVIPSV